MSLRPRLCARNVVVFVPLLFGGLLWQGAMLLRALAALLVLCALGGAASIMDDLADMDSDRRHPLKADRPIPSGRLRMSHALLAILMLLVGGLLAAQYLGLRFFAVALAYVVLLFTYTFVLSRVVILDMFALAASCALCAAAGAVAVGLAVEPWVLGCSSGLGLLLAAGKRWCDVKALAGTSRAPGPAAAPVLGQIMTAAAAWTVLGYALHTAHPETTAQFGRGIIYTVPFVAYGVFRYIWLVRNRSEAGGAGGRRWGDWPLALDVLLWAGITAAIVYG